MQRFILSTVSVLLATAAVAPTAQALPKADADFNLQTLRLSELDTRNKSEESEQPYYYSDTYAYPETSTQASPQTVSAEKERIQTDELLTQESPATQEEVTSPALSLIQQRHQSLDRN